MKDTEIFDDKSFTDLIRDIHDSTLIKRGLIADIIKELRGFLKDKNPDSAAVFAPMIKDYIDVMVRNDDHLIKIAAIIQRIMLAEEGKGIDGLLSDLEKEQLLSQAKEELEVEVKKLEKETISDPKLPEKTD